MEEPLSLFAPVEQAALALCAQNELLGRYGLSLSEAEAAALITNEREALRDSGRIAFGEGVLKKLLYAFCDSPYIDQNSLADTMDALLQTFYYYRNEADGYLSDDELIDGMAFFFNGKAQGSLEYMAESSLGELLRALRRRED